MKLKNTLALLTALSLSVCVLAGCGDSDSSSQSTSSAADSASVPDSDEESKAEAPAPAANYNKEALAVKDELLDQEALDQALCTVGDASLIQAKMQKALAGEEVTVAYLGGSITEGYSAGAEKCYAKLSFEKFKEAFGGGDNIKYVNAGISGTPSKLGNIRLQRDILSHDPDIVFIEFAVNDAMDDEHQAAYESIVRDLLEKDIAPVLLFSRTETGYSAQSYMKKIGEYYNLPMISYADAVTYLLDNGKMQWKEFSDDYTHPNFKGHALVADMIGYYFEQAYASAPDTKPYPDTPLTYMVQQGMQMFENADIEPESMGSWKKGSNVAFFKDGWSHDPEEGNDPLVFKFKGKFAHIVYKTVKTGDYGDISIKIYVDGELSDTRTLKSVTKDGWGNPITNMLSMQAAEKEFTIEISMAEGCETQQAEILAIAHN